jgi:hypothetical protein
MHSPVGRIANDRQKDQSNEIATTSTAFYPANGICCGERRLVGKSWLGQ